MRRAVPVNAVPVRGAAIAAALILAACVVVPSAAAAAPAAKAVTAVPAVRTSTPIQHFVYLMQGSSSFDHYFGTYPGADGIAPKTCQPLVVSRPSSGCVKPFPLHGQPSTVLGSSQGLEQKQFDNGRMDGFVSTYQSQGRDGTVAMGYYDQRDLPVSWQVASDYVLFDRFFSSSQVGSRVNRSYWVAAAPPPGTGAKVPAAGYGDDPTIFDRLQAQGVSWKFYVQDYDPADTFTTTSPTGPGSQTVRVPLLDYARFVDNPALSSHIVDLGQYQSDLVHGTLPAVAFIASASAGERSARSIPAGQQLLRTLVNELAASRFWSSSAMLVSYDSAGGWYDHVAPPKAAGNGQLGFRVPALLISAFARKGAVVSTPLDATSALAFIERNWRVTPLHPRDAQAADLTGAFAFGDPPRPAQVIVTSSKPRTKIASVAPIYWSYGLAVLVLLLTVAGAFAADRLPRPRWRGTKEADPEAEPDAGARVELSKEPVQ